jgi:hypothetical protein
LHTKGLVCLWGGRQAFWRSFCTIGTNGAVAVFRGPRVAGAGQAEGRFRIALSRHLDVTGILELLSRLARNIVFPAFGLRRLRPRFFAMHRDRIAPKRRRRNRREWTHGRRFLYNHWRHRSWGRHSYR